MGKILDKNLVERIEKLERDVAILKTQHKTTSEKSVHEEFHKNSWEQKVI